MKNYILTAILALFSLVAFADAQSELNKNMSDYRAALATGKYEDAARAAAQASAACASVKNYEGAFSLLRNAEQALDSKGATAQAQPQAQYPVARARFDLYQALGNKSGAEAQLKTMIKLAQAGGIRRQISSMLFAAAQFYYSQGLNEKGNRCISQLIRQYENGDDYKAAEAAYHKLIEKAVSAGDASLVEHTYDSYMQWSDSVAAADADTELAKALDSLGAAEATIKAKNRTITGKTAVIVTFIALFAGALVALGLGAILYRRLANHNSRLQASVEAANRQSQAKSEIIHNMSATMAPALDSLDSDSKALRDLRGYVRQMGELSDVGDTAPKSDDQLDEVDAAAFCREIADKVRPKLKDNVTVVVNAAKGTARIDADETRRILLHLLENAAKHTPAKGRITLSYKKRGAKVYEFSVSDSGPGIPKDRRESLFTPFADANADISQSDALGLPICALRADKINGKLSLDNDHAIGATFVLTLRS